MLPQLKKLMDERGVQVVLLFGSRTEEDLIYREDFYKFAEDNPNFRFMPSFSRELPANATPDSRRGYVQDQLTELSPDGAHDIAYLCGNPNMVDTCFEALKDFGLSVHHIRREKYVSSK
jgi:NAD(P)H-flavin reductase